MRCVIAFTLLAASALADGPVIENVTVTGDRFDVTLSHLDTGWDHYADGWEVLNAQGNSLGFRELFLRMSMSSPLPGLCPGCGCRKGQRLFMRARGAMSTVGPMICSRSW